MNRRKFLTGVAAGGGLLLLGGGVWAHRAHARDRVRQELMRHATPLLTAKAHQELLTLPEHAREEMRRYFHGVCLNVHDFAQEVCSPQFAEHLGERHTPEARQEMVLLAFMRNVTTEAEVVNRVQVIAEDVSRDLDRNWANCCVELAGKWDVAVKEYRATVTAEDLTARLTPLVQQGLRTALDEARSAGQRPVLAGVVNEMGKSAVLLLPMAAEAPWVGWPLFAVQALRPVFDYFIGRVRDRAGDLQWAVSDRLATLGNRMGSEFETEVRTRIAALHRWQDEAVDTAAAQQAEQLIRFL